MTYKFYLCLLSTMLYTLSVQAQQVNKETTHRFSLKQCLDWCTKNNAQIKNALLDIKIQNEVNRGITAAAYPSVALTGNVNNFLNIPVSLVPAQFFGGPAGTFAPVQFGTKYSSTIGVQAQQLLFDGQVFIGLQARKTSIDFQQKAAEVTEENIKANVYKIYYQLAASKTQIELLDANINRLQKLLADVKAMYKAGVAEQLDVDKLQVQVSNIEVEKQKVNNSIEMGYVGLKTLIGMPLQDSLILTDSISMKELTDKAVIDVKDVFNQRKEYQYLSLAKKLNEYNVKRYQYSYLPTISAMANYNKQAYRTKFTFLEKGDWFTSSMIGVNVNMPLFQGFGRDAKVKQAKLELEKTQNSIENFKLSADAEAKQAWLKYNNAIATLQNQQRNMQLAEQVLVQTEKKLKAGVGSNTEVNASQTDLKQAQTNYITALYDAIIAQVDYLKATGKLF